MYFIGIVMQIINQRYINIYYFINTNEIYLMRIVATTRIK